MRTVSELLSNQRGHLQNLMQKSEHLKDLTEKLRSLLPEHLATYCEVASWENGKIIVHTSNSAAGTVLRYQLPKILPLLRLDPRYQNVQELICHNRPPIQINKNDETKIPAPNYSDYAAALLESMAQTVTDKNVQKSMQKLAKSISKKGNL
ncbi:MAG: DciA family protein [Gammaproteobacteria bacterium]